MKCLICKKEITSEIVTEQGLAKCDDCGWTSTLRVVE
jgi:DNA-directed RNA polymerase subunit RPC12/RpoP